MKKNTYRRRKYKRTALSPDGAATLRGYRSEADRVAELLRELPDDFLSSTDAESDWRNIKPKQGPEAE